MRRKFTTGVVLLLIIGVGYWGYGNLFSEDGVVRYATAQAQQDTLIVSVSGSGQVSASSQVDIKPRVSGDIVYLGVKNGQEINAGEIIAQLDALDARKTVRDAESSLESAQLSLEKMKLQYKQQSRGDTLNKNYEDGLGILANLYGEFPIILDASNQIFFGTNLRFDTQGQNDNNIEYYARYSDKFTDTPGRLKQLFLETKGLYQQGLFDYQLANRGSGEERGRAIQSGYELTAKAAELIKTGRDVVRYVKDIVFGLESNTVHARQALIDSHAADLATYATSIDNYLKDLLSLTNVINSQHDAIEAQPLDLRSQELTVRQRENALHDVQEKLADYFVRAPFDGIIANINVKKEDAVSAGTAIATLVTKQKIAEISLNEIDIAQVKTGQKTTLTFDAIPDLTLTGQIVELDALGTVLQGVVTYTVKIGFDTQDERVKTAMTVTAAIVTEAKPDALLIPNSAVKSQGGIIYVEIPNESDLSVATANVSDAVFRNPTRQQQVETGLSNDESTEIVSGLQEGDVVITRTIQPTSAQSTQTQQNSPLRIPGVTGGGFGR